MKIGLVCKYNCLDIVPKYDNYNYINFIVNSFRKRNDLYLFDWRDLGEDFFIKEGIIANKKGLFKDSFNIFEFDVLFIKQLGKIHKEQGIFLNFLDIMENYSGKVINDIKTIRDNLSKQYLLDLHIHNFPVIPTKMFNKSFNLYESRKIFFGDDFEELVIKPFIFGEQGYSVRQLNSFKDDQEFENYKKHNGALIIQPLIKDIFEKGEISLIYLDKDFTHSVIKYSGNFKVNASLDAIIKIHTPSKRELEICNGVLEYWPNKLGYTRIDMIPYKGDFLISEVETINPSFYIENVPGLGRKFISKLERFLKSI